MSSGTGARSARALLVAACVLAIGLASALPASAQEGASEDNNAASATNNGDDKKGDGEKDDGAKRDRKKGNKKGKRVGRYYLKEGPCDLKKLPKRGVSQWTPAGEHIVHKVKYGQGLQKIAKLYGFKGDKAFRVLWDANPQLDELKLDRSGITVRVPACPSRMIRRKLPKPPPPPEPEEPEESEPSDDDESEESAPEPEEEAPPVAGDSVWDQLAECESGGNWAANTGNGYYGGIQFSLPTWESVGGSGYPHEHSREEQIKRGKILQERSGWGQWPHCAAELGLL
jgi:Transglycosylase-like domain